MDNESAKSYVTILLNHVFDLLYVNNFGINHAEHDFLKIGETLINHENLREWFVLKVEQTISPENANANVTNMSARPEWFIDGDLICFLAHTLRWNEYSDIADRRKLYLKNSGRILGSRDISDSILEAMSDDWEDQEFYECFK